MNNPDIKGSIDKAFMTLIDREGYDSITVTKIASEAYISRATFYKYYKSKEDILKNLTNQMILEFRKLQKENVGLFYNIDMSDREDIKRQLLPGTIKRVSYLYERRNFLMLNSKVPLDFIKIFREVYYDHFRNALLDFYHEKIDKETLDYYATYLTNGVTSILENWFYSRFKDTVEIVSNKILNLLSVSLQNIWLTH